MTSTNEKIQNTNAIMGEYLKKFYQSLNTSETLIIIKAMLTYRKSILKMFWNLIGPYFYDAFKDMYMKIEL